jgi:hypothetical protein
MKIAVCLHGQSRTWEKCVNNIKKFFDIGTEHEIYYFIHTWGFNSWKQFDKDYHYYVDEKVDNSLFGKLITEFGSITRVRVSIDDLYIFPSLDVNTEAAKNPTARFESSANLSIPSTWNSMLYSAMYANFMKQRYEFHDNTRFDLVVSTRLDQCFDPEFNFLTYLPKEKPLRQDWLYSEVVDYPHEFYQQAINDVFYYGSSRVLDQIDSFYRVYHNGMFFKLTNTSYYDGALANVGCGVLLYKWAVLKNIHVENISHVKSQIVRQFSEVNDTIIDYQKLIKESLVYRQRGIQN